MQKKPPSFESSPDRLSRTPRERDEKGTAMVTIAAEAQLRKKRTERLRAMRLAASTTN